MFTRLLLKCLAEGLGIHQVPPLRLLLLCLTFACGSALADELFRYTPAATLSENQVSTRNHLASEQGFKSIAIIEINKAALNSNVITLTVNGKNYRLEGKLTQGPPFPIGDLNGKILRMAGQVIWSGQSPDGFGSMNYSDLGSIHGQFTLGGQIYKVESNEGMNGFLVEIEPESAWPDPLFHPPYIPPTLTAKQEKVRDHWAKQPETISVTIVQVDKAALKSNVITVTIKGKRYRFDGKWTRTEPRRIDEGRLSASILVPSSMRPGMTSWDGQGPYGSGSIYFHDEGEVSGNVAITRDEGRGHYRLVSAGDLAFLIEYDDMAQRRTIPKEDLSARLDVRWAQQAVEEIILRIYKGERLLGPAKEASLDPQYRAQLDFAPADRSALGLYPVHVNRLAIDAPVAVIVIDGKEYRFVGKVSTTRGPPPYRSNIRKSEYAAVTDLWEGHTSSGDRAEINRSLWNMSGDIYVGGRHFSLGTRGEFGLLSDLNPTLVAERNTEWQRAFQKGVREAAAKWRPPPVPLVPVETPVGMTKPPSPAAQVLPNAQPCEQKTRFLSGLDEADSFSQPAHLRSFIAELRGVVKAEMRELQC